MSKIAIVDDAEDTRDFLYFLLKDRHTVVRYSNGAELLAHYRLDAPDLIILDVGLEDMDGFAVLAEIRADTSSPQMPIIAVTAHAMAGDRERCLAAGFDDYVAKPILDLEAFLNQIERHLKRIHRPGSN